MTDRTNQTNQTNTHIYKKSPKKENIHAHARISVEVSLAREGGEVGNLVVGEWELEGGVPKKGQGKHLNFLSLLTRGAIYLTWTLALTENGGEPRRLFAWP